MFVNATVLTPAASVKAGSDAVPLTTDSACGGPPFTDALTVHFPPLGAAGTGSVTVHEAPATAPVSVGVALPPLASAAVVKPDGHVPVNVDVALAWLEPAGACTAFEIWSVDAAGPPEVTTRWEIACRFVKPPVPPLNPRYALAGSETACEST